MKVRAVLEVDPGWGHVTATVPGIPALVCDAKSEKAALRLVRDGIAFTREEAIASGRRSGSAPPARPVR